MQASNSSHLRQSGAHPTDSAEPVSAQAHAQPRLAIRALAVLAALGILGLSLVNLTAFPRPWFDEGSHLHVPKSIVMFGRYADYSSEGFRYYGPSIGIGPTVMLPVAAAFRLFGIGLIQARLVMIAYLLVAIAAMFGLARAIGGARMAWLAGAILVGSQAINLLEWGRQMVGEVPALAFLALGWLAWLKAEQATRARTLVLAGVSFGLAAVTKSQTALILIPTLFVTWLANLIFYRRLPQRYFLIPLIITVACFGAWQVIALAFLGPGTLAENLDLLRQFSSGAAFVFSPKLIAQSAKNLLGFDVFAGWLAPILVYGLTISLRRSADGQRWGNLMIFVMGGLAWYVFASISWLRYAFAPLAMAALVAARLIDDLLVRFDPRPRAWWAALQRGDFRAAIAPAALAVFALMSLAPLGLTARQIVDPPEPSALQVADYLNANVSREALIETWEPELGFLTDHRYHFPPHILLDTAVRSVWLDGPAPAERYDFTAESPDYLVVGAFAEYTGMYPLDRLAGRFQLIASFGAYDVYAAASTSVLP